jgi:hypothetical protein
MFAPSQAFCADEIGNFHAVGLHDELTSEARSSFFNTLPMVLRGSASTTMTCFGTL